MRFGVKLMIAGGMLLACEGMAQETKALPMQSTTLEQTFFLRHTQTQAEQNEIVTALRNMLSPPTHIFLVQSENAIVMEGLPDQMRLAEKILQEIDLPHKVYRLTYTLTEIEGGKRVGVQHFSVLVTNGQRSQMKQGDRVPLVTGSATQGNVTTNFPANQITYVDVGLNVDATVDAVENGVGLRTKVEISSVAGELSSTLSQDPVIRQTTLEGTSVLTLGKPQELGSLDVPGSTRHTQVEVIAELVK